MSSDEQEKIKNLFDKYIFGFMCADIERELTIARKGQQAGNFLCALGLLSYTEFMGALKEREIGQRGKSGKHFNVFFDYMGANYKDFRESFPKKDDVYHIFRCGLAHEYFVKHACTIFMLNLSEPVEILGTDTSFPSLYTPDVTLNPPLEMGIGQASNRRYFFVVEKYYQDFRSACTRLFAEIMQEDKPVILSFLDDSWVFQEG